MATNGNLSPILTFLVVDDDNSNRLILKSILERLNYKVITASNGAEAIKCYTEYLPDMILMDVVMPVLNGYEASRKIKKLSQGKYIPIIFITSMTDDASLSKCIECGGDDFLTKPFNKVILQSKINALSRTRKLYNEIRSQQNELEGLNERLVREQEVAENIFSNALLNESPPDNTNYILKPHSICSGDIFLCTETPNYHQLYLLGDFTGHGLSAAIGALPTSDTFYTLAQDSRSTEEILSAINDKLCAILPTGLYCALGIIDIDHNNGIVRVWNGGIPDILVKRINSNTIDRYSSSHLPLGVLESSKIDFQLSEIAIEPYDILYIYSDGPIEATNIHKEMFGSDRMEKLLLENNSNVSAIDEIGRQINEFCGEAEQDDDITLAEIIYSPQDIPTETNILNTTLTLVFDFNPDSVKKPLPIDRIIHRISSNIKLIEKTTNEIKIIITELYNNALDHGLLQLSSKTKDTDGGFTQYYDIRNKKLSQLNEGYIKIVIQMNLGMQGEYIDIMVSDSGNGFNLQSHRNSTLNNITLTHGRGFAIISSLCEDLTVNDNGNTATARYHLTSSPTHH